jgi:hypothetical protein
MSEGFVNLLAPPEESRTDRQRGLRHNRDSDGSYVGPYPISTAHKDAVRLGAPDENGTQ